VKRKYLSGQADQPTVSKCEHQLGRSLTVIDREVRSLRFSFSNQIVNRAIGDRADLMGDLAIAYPAIVQLGGEEAGHGMVKVMREMCSQWK